MRTPGLLITLTALAIVVVSLPAEAFEFSGGVSLGGFQVGTAPRLAVSPHVGASWHTKSDFVVALHDQCSFLPPTDAVGMGFYNQASISIGYSSKTAIFSAGPSLAIYSMTTCGLTFVWARCRGGARRACASRCVRCRTTGGLGQR